jgi:hypothetical protein
MINEILTRELQRRGQRPPPGAQFDSETDFDCPLCGFPVRVNALYTGHPEPEDTCCWEWTLLCVCGVKIYFTMTDQLPASADEWADHVLAIEKEGGVAAEAKIKLIRSEPLNE